MAVMNINPTRMELTRLKKRLVTARRGHKLLKDKRDELMRQFLIKIKQNQQLRLEVEQALKEANAHIAIARSVMQSEVLDVAMLHSKQKVSLSISEKNIMSVRVPEFTTEFKVANANAIYSYGLAFTATDLDVGIEAFSQIMPQLLRLAEVEKACQMMASEIEKTRRRVNALEHVVIPQYQDTIRYITMKLEENERGSITRLMKVKDMMLEKAHQTHKSQDL